MFNGRWATLGLKVKKVKKPSSMYSPTYGLNIDQYCDVDYFVPENNDHCFLIADTSGHMSMFLLKQKLMTCFIEKKEKGPTVDTGDKN